MARPRKNPVEGLLAGNPVLLTWAETLGEALGRGVARGINVGLSNVNVSAAAASPAPAVARRGRPPKAAAGAPVSADNLCSVQGCGRAARSKGLCSAHYQAERRRLLSKSKG